MPNSINSLSPDFRDFLLNRNLVTDTVTNNGLYSLLSGIGIPLTDIGTYPEVVQPSGDIVVDGNLYKDLNIITNQFQGSDNDYELVSINYTNNNPSTSAFIYSSNYVDDEGILIDTLNTPANGAFQGGDIRQFNTAKNLYFDPTKQTLVSLESFGAPNVQYTNYQEINNGIVNNAIDVLGSVLTGGGVGISGSGGLVPDFDLRSTLLGRVLGGTGVISDTPLGQAGAKYLALALANNASFGLQQETIGRLNLNPLNIAMNGVGSIVVPNYNITVPKSSLGRVLDFGARVLGFESPISLYSTDSSIFSSENPISNIDRALSQISNTGKGQVLALFANVKMNKYAPGFRDDRVIDENLGVNANIYAFGTTDGKIIDFLNSNVDLNVDGNITGDEVGVNYPISQSNYNLDGLIENSGFNGVPSGQLSPLDTLAYGADGLTKYSWGDDKDNKNAQDTFNPNGFTSPNSILTKTQRLFNSGRMRTLASGEVGTRNNMLDPVQTAVREGGLISKGSGVLTEAANNGNFNDVDNVFCRTWSTFNRYNQVQDLQKSSGIDGRTAYRKGYNNGDSVLGDNGFVKIGPYIGDSTRDGNGETNIKNFMFSLENLAWADNHESLTDCEKGPGDLMTGKKGRIMWFPPYDLSVTENVSVNWESTNFIGRGEPIYTYNNTERTGTLQFKIVVDHPSYLNAIRSETDDYIASFFAGCTDIDPVLAEKLTTIERSQIETERDGPPLAPKIPEAPTDTFPKVDFFFSNDNYEINPLYEDGIGGGLGTTIGQKVVSIDIMSFPDNSDFGLNGINNPSFGSEGGWISTQGQERLRQVLNEECQACRLEIEGYASTQGSSVSKNQELSVLRAQSVKDWFLANIFDTESTIYGTGDGQIDINKRFQVVKGKGQTGNDCPNVPNPNFGQPNQLKFLQNQDVIGCKVARKVNVKIVWDADLALKLTNNEKDPVVTPKEKWRISQKITNRFYNECNYFEKLRQEDAVVYSSLKEKLKFFHPAFHAITPEGLNSRLTFLQQCTRQGPTNLAGVPDNLAFGRPPICILRLGDFYHTKIAIDNISISYEPLVWDLNPEGIGVQPMIATVDLSFKMIGGQSMKGPINKLQNAVSFNFFGNTQIYDERADKIAKVADVTGKPEDYLQSNDEKYVIVPGITVMAPTEETTEEQFKGGINGNGDETVGVIQTVISNNQLQEDNSKSDDKKILDNLLFKLQSESNGATTISWYGSDYNLLTKEYSIKLKTSVTGNNGWLDVLEGKITPNGNNSITSTITTWPSTYTSTGNIGSDGDILVFFQVIIEIPSEENVNKKISIKVEGSSESQTEIGYIITN